MLADKAEKKEHGWSVNLFAGVSEKAGSLIYKKQTGPMSTPNS